MGENYAELEHACEYCGHYAWWVCGECQTHQETVWPKEAHLTTLKSSHAELLEALKDIKDMLAFYEGSDQNVGGRTNPVVLINAEYPGGDFPAMLSFARQAIERASEVK